MRSESEASERLDASVAATGTAWVGSGVGSVNTAIEGLFERATTEIQIAAYDVTGGADELIAALRGLLARGIRVTMVVNRLGKKETRVREGLAGLSARFSHFELFDFARVREGRPPRQGHRTRQEGGACRFRQSYLGEGWFATTSWPWSSPAPRPRPSGD